MSTKKPCEQCSKEFPEFMISGVKYVVEKKKPTTKISTIVQMCPKCKIALLKRLLDDPT